MSKFETLTKYIPLIQEDMVGAWVFDEENDGTPEHPIQMPYVGYSDMIYNFISDVYTFDETNQELELTRYREILEENGLDWSMNSMMNADVSKLNAQCVLAFILAAVRAERFSDGVLLDLFTSGRIVKWLDRLQTIG